MFIKKRKYEWIIPLTYPFIPDLEYQLGYHAGQVESSNRALSAQDAQQAIEEAERIVRGETK